MVPFQEIYILRSIRIIIITIIIIIIIITERREDPIYKRSFKAKI